MSSTILCYGDSNTYGYDPRSCLGGRYPRSIRWTGRLAEAGYAVRGEGMNGRSIPRGGGTAAALRLLAGIPCRLLAVQLGVNDLLNDPALMAEDCARRMEDFLSALLRGGVTAPDRLLLVAPPPCVPGTWVQEERLLVQSARMGAAYRAAADRLGIPFADAGDWGVERMFDGVHFSPEGHRAYAAGMQDALTRLGILPDAGGAADLEQI